MPASVRPLPMSGVAGKLNSTPSPNTLPDVTITGRLSAYPFHIADAEPHYSAQWLLAPSICRSAAILSRMGGGGNLSGVRQIENRLPLCAASLSAIASISSVSDNALSAVVWGAASSDVSDGENIAKNPPPNRPALRQRQKWPGCSVTQKNNQRRHHRFQAGRARVVKLPVKYGHLAHKIWPLRRSYKIRVCVFTASRYANCRAI